MYESQMTRAEMALLLTVANVLRGTIQDMLPTANGYDDLRRLDEALAPFEVDRISVLMDTKLGGSSR
jgi:hypothetical protein